MRNKPETIGITLNEHGWANVEELIVGVNKKYPIDMQILEKIVDEDDKNRLYVHLSNDIETAEKVGKRHGKPVIYEVDCKRMIEDGIEFFKSENNVWLVEGVPVKYLKKL